MEKINIILGTAHDKNTLGKCSPDKSIREWEYSREICTRIKDVLSKKGYNCIIDILGEDEKSLANRCKIVNNYCTKYGTNNCIYVSVHLNAAGNGQWMNARGLSVFVSNNCSSNSKKLATSIYIEGEKLGLKGNRCVPKNKYWTANFYVLTNTRCPAVLTENLFQDNKEDVKFLLSEEGKQAIVDMHVNGIINYINNLE